MKELKKYMCETCGKAWDGPDVAACAWPGCKTDTCSECAELVGIKVGMADVVEVCEISCCKDHANKVAERMREALTSKVILGLLRGRRVRKDAGKPRAKRTKIEKETTDAVTA